MNQPPTDLDELETLVKNVPAGPWTVDDSRAELRGSHGNLLADLWDDRLGAYFAAMHAALPALLAEVHRLRAELEDQADADTVADRAAQVITSMGADIRALTTQRDRYRTAWQSARSRAQAYGDGILRVVEDRESYPGWLKEAETARDEARLQLARVIGECNRLASEADELLEQEAELIVKHCPDHGPQDQSGVWMDCHCAVADDMRHRAAVSAVAADAEETHVVADDSDDPEHVDDCPGCEATRPCGHDDYHDPHEWADRPGVWCPGHSHADDALAAPVVAAVSSAAENGGQP